MGIFDGILAGPIRTILGVVGPGATLIYRTKSYNALSDETYFSEKSYPVACGPAEDIMDEDRENDSTKKRPFKLIVAADGLPSKPDPQTVELVYNGSKAQIDSVETIDPGNDPVVYILNCHYL